MYLLNKFRLNYTYKEVFDYIVFIERLTNYAADTWNEHITFRRRYYNPLTLKNGYKIDYGEMMVYNNTEEGDIYLGITTINTIPGKYL